MPQAPDDDPLRYVEGYDEAAMQAYGDARAAEAEARKDAAYEERNRVVALLAALLPSVRTRTAIEGWSEDWHGCVYITLPDGSQASWHFHDSQAHLFAHVPEGQATWDGHTTPEKYERIERCAAARPNIAAEARREALESVEALLLSQGGWPAAELVERVRALAEPPKEG